MPLADINKAIVKQAQKEIMAIKAEGEKRLEEIKAKWAKKITDRQAEIVDEAKRKANQKIQQMQFKLQSQFQLEVLKAKNDIINQAYEKAQKKLIGLSEKDYEELMLKLINQINLSEGELISVVGKEKSLKKALEKSGKKFKISDKTIEGDGGFIFQSNKLEINNTFSNLIANSKEQTILEVTKILF